MKTRKTSTKHSKSRSKSKFFSSSPKSRKKTTLPAKNRRNSPKSTKPRLNTHGDQILLAHYLGKNYQKFLHHRFNFAAFCFGTWYFFYRQMFLTGLILFLVEITLSNLLQYLPISAEIRLPLNFALCVLYALVAGFLANPLYRRRATHQVIKLKNQNRGSGFNDLQRLIFHAGGPRIGQLTAGIFLELTFGIAATIAVPAASQAIGYHLQPFSFFGATITAPESDNSDYHPATSGDPDSIFAGTMLSDPSFVITDEFDIDLPAVFHKVDSAAQFRYEYTSPATFYNICRVNISTPESYADGDLLVNQIASYTNNGLATLTYRTTVNGIDWTYFSTKQAPGKIYYYGTTKGNQAYLLEYDVETSAPADCEKYLQEVLKSIKIKE